MKIITISGVAQAGKDSTAIILKELIEKDGMKCIIVHYADYLKHLCKEYFNWNGEKDEDGRTLLQQIGTELCRKNNPDIWVKVILEFAKAIETEFDYMLIPDTRFQNEIQIWENTKFPIKTIKIIRTEFDNGSTVKQKNHASERDLDKFKFDHTISAKNLKELYKKVSDMWHGDLSKTLKLKKIVKVDFDGTLFTEAYPKIGKPKVGIINMVKTLKKAGAVVILDTCREGKLLEEAVEACSKFGLTFDCVNENYPERIEFFGGDCRKISADWALDDRAISLADAEKLIEMLEIN